VSLALPDYFCALTCPSVGAIQEVSTPPSDSFHVLTCPFVCAIQGVSAPRSLGFFPCPDLPLRLRYPGSECPSLARILSMSRLSPPSALSRELVPLARSDSFRFLTYPSIRAIQLVSVPCFLGFFRVLTCPPVCVIQSVSAHRSL
jgi:hypothetical protein